MAKRNKGIVSSVVRDYCLERNHILIEKSGTESERKKKKRIRKKKEKDESFCSRIKIDNGKGDTIIRKRKK